MANNGAQGDKGRESNNYNEFLETTPCARSSFLNGIIGGLVAGTGRFIFTKHVRKSCDLAVVSFFLISIGNWGVCRYLNHKHRLEIEKTVDLVTKYSNTKARESEDHK